VREELRQGTSAYAERGLRVTRVEADSDNGQPFPDLVIYLEHEGVEGDRVLRYNLEHGGELEASADAATTLCIALLEYRPRDVAQLPRAAAG
jgi:hypothetical protein